VPGIKITADATCDLPYELLERYNIDVCSLYVQFKGKMLKDKIEITPKEIFDDVKNGGPIPTTSAPSIGDYTEFFSKIRENYDEIVHINISSAISASHQSAKLAAESMSGVYIVNSKSLSSGTGLLVLKAAEMVEKGLNGAEIAENLNAMADKVKASFVIDRLDFMKKGGRCSALAALGANMLKIKPSIVLINGMLKLGQKYRGSLTRALEAYVDDQLAGKADSLDLSCIFITHSLLDDPGLVDFVKNRIAMHANFQNVYRSDASSVISAHCGPNTLGILYMLR